MLLQAAARTGPLYGNWTETTFRWVPPIVSQVFFIFPENHHTCCLIHPAYIIYIYMLCLTPRSQKNRCKKTDILNSIPMISQWCVIPPWKPWQISSVPSDGAAIPGLPPPVNGHLASLKRWWFREFDHPEMVVQPTIFVWFNHPKTVVQPKTDMV